MRVCSCLPTTDSCPPVWRLSREPNRGILSTSLACILYSSGYGHRTGLRSNGWQLISDSWVDSVIACDAHSFDSIMILHCFHGSVSAVVVVFVSGFDYSFTQLPRNIQPSQQRRLRAGATIPLSSHGCHLYPRRGDEK